jgi:adenylate kinase
LNIGGPGSGKLTQAKKLLDKNPGWVHLSMGDLLRTEVAQKGTAGDKWGMIGDLVSQGEMAPEVSCFQTLTKKFRIISTLKG